MRVIPYSSRQPTRHEVEITTAARPSKRSPVSLVPHTIDGSRIIAGYLCTPLVKFPVNSLKSGAKVMGTTIAELGNRNRPLDMIVYQKNGQEFLLMSNNSRGVMKAPTSPFGKAEAITADTRHRRRALRTVASMTGVQQLDLLDRAAARAGSRRLNSKRSRFRRAHAERGGRNGGGPRPRWRAVAQLRICGAP
jgi:hypothetical protein